LTSVYFVIKVSKNDHKFYFWQSQLIVLAYMYQGIKMKTFNKQKRLMSKREGKFGMESVSYMFATL